MEIPVTVTKYVYSQGEEPVVTVLDAFAYTLADYPDFEEEVGGPQEAGICVNITRKNGSIEVILTEAALLDALRAIHVFRKEQAR